MGQIVFNEQKPKYANKLAITTGTKANWVLDENEIWLIDSTNATKINGKGKYDKYIKGDGQTAAKNLPLLSVDPDVPTSLSELDEDANHRTVTDEDKQRWNNGTGGGGTPVANSEDITVIADSQEGVNRLQLANKEYDQSEYSGLGKVYLRKNIQTVHTKTSEVLFNDFNATGIYSKAYDNSYNAKYKELIEAGTYDADGKTAANAAYTTAYNNAITAGKTTVEATNLGNAAYVKAYKAAIKGDEDAEAAVVSVNTASVNSGTTAGNTAWSTEYPNITSWNRRQYIDGRFITVDDDKYINITPGNLFSMCSCRIEVNAGELYKVFAKKTDTASGTMWLPRFWMITETPAAGATRAKVLQAYKIDNENFVEGQPNETVFIEVESNGVLWINYNTYTGAEGQCIIEKISDTQNTIEVNSIDGMNYNNTEYIIQYDYNLNGGILNVPKNSVLKFEGGSIINGYIKGDNSTIIASHSANILSNITLIGKWTNIEFYPKWFGAVADGVTDDTNVLQSMLDLSTNISKHVELIWYGYTFRTTRQLYLKSNTYISGGTIKAKFDNQISWILKTYNYVAAQDKVFGDSTAGALLDWGTHDSGTAQKVNNSYIKDLTLSGEYNEHLTNGEFDGTYTPIFGGLCLMGTDTCTDNVHISGVGVGLGRGSCLWTYDSRLKINSLFIGFAGYAINGHSIRDSYINAYAKTEATEGTSTKVTPYYPEYHNISTMPADSYIYGNGGIDMVEGNPRRPYFCNIQLNYDYSTVIDNLNNRDFVEFSEDEEPSVEVDNVLIDILSEVGVCVTTDVSVTIRHPWFETTNKALIYSSGAKVQVDAPYVYARNDYDIYAIRSVITLKGTSGTYGICCAGGLSGEGTYDGKKKYYLSDSRVNILDAKVAPYPINDDRFYFLNNGSIQGLPVSVINSNTVTDDTIGVAIGTYYRFNYKVNTLNITLPDMSSITTVQPIILYIETGAAPNIRFTTTDNKAVTEFSNYEIDMNSNYEINCMYNGQKWVIASAVIL